MKYTHESKFNYGDKVKVVNYGHKIFMNNKPYDLAPKLVGQIGVVRGISNQTKHITYKLSGVKGKTAWFEEDQLELVKA